METLIMEDMLRYNFYLSKWFTGKKQDNVIPGTAFLFLNQVSLLFLAVFLIVDKFLPFTLSPKIFTGILILVVLFIMYGLQKTVQAKVRENKYDKDYNSLTKKAIYKNRLIALLLFILPFILCFIIAILFYR
jgi:uncharacterized membrane protein